MDLRSTSGQLEEQLLWHCVYLEPWKTMLEANPKAASQAEINKKKKNERGVIFRYLSKQDEKQKNPSPLMH